MGEGWGGKERGERGRLRRKWASQGGRVGK